MNECKEITVMLTEREQEYLKEVLEAENAIYTEQEDYFQTNNTALRDLNDKRSNCQSVLDKINDAQNRNINNNEKITIISNNLHTVHHMLDALSKLDRNLPLTPYGDETAVLAYDSKNKVVYLDSENFIEELKSDNELSEEQETNDTDLQNDIKRMVTRFFLNDAQAVYSDNHEWRIEKGNDAVAEIYYNNQSACQIKDSSNTYVCGYDVIPAYAEMDGVANYVGKALKSLDYKVNVRYKYYDEELDMTQGNERSR